MNKQLENCLKSLRESSGKPEKFGQLANKFNSRFSVNFSIDVGNIMGVKIGFDNHKNHFNPHIHIETKNKDIGKCSFDIESGLPITDNYKKIKSELVKDIKEWIIPKKECLKLIYNNIQNCRDADDFQPMINAMNKFL